MTLDNTNSKKAKNIVGIAITIILAVVFLYIAFKDVDFSKTLKSMQNISIGWFLLFIFFFYLSHFLRAVRWQVMIRSVKEKTSIIYLFAAVMIGYGVNVPVPRLGEIYRGLFLGKWEGISRTSMLGSIILERFIDILSFTVGALICIYIYSGNLLAEISWLDKALIISFIFVFAFTVFLFLVILFKEKFSIIIIKLSSLLSVKLSSKAESFFNTLIIGFSSIKDVKGYLLTALYSVLILVCYTLSTWAAFYSLGMENLGEISLGMAWVFMIISAFGVIIPTPGGIGSYHAIAIFVLCNLYGFSKEISAAYALLTHTVQVVLFIFSALFSFHFVNNLRVRQGMKKEDFVSVFRLRGETEK